jgi:tyrosyl-tRNA synthetase
MFGKLMSIPDSALEQYYLLLLDEDLDAGRHPGEAKRELARRLVDRFDGAGAGATAEAAFDRVHVHGQDPEEIEEVVVEAGPDGLVHVPAALERAFGISRSEARRLLGQGGVRADDRPLDAANLDVPASKLDGSVVRIGRRRFRRLRVADPA